MNEFLKQFQMEDHGSFGGFFSGVPDLPAIGDNAQEPSGSLRDQYIKPGYEKSKGGGSNRIDTDLDEKFNIGELDSILRKQEGAVVPFQKPQSETRFFGQSVQYKTVRNSDGSVEIQKIVRDNSGNEERTITRKFGDKEHTVIIKKDKDGREERTENFINMDSNDGSQMWNSLLPQEKHVSPSDNPQGGILSDWFSKWFR